LTFSKKRVILNQMKNTNKKIGGMIVKKHLGKRGYWDVIDARARVTFTGTLAEIRQIARDVSKTLKASR
jgi:hypothetical protein